jgi:hypothetical protein
MASSTLSHPSCVLFPQLLSWGSMDVPALLAEVTRAREAATAAEVARVATVLAVETPIREPATAWDSATHRVKDAEDQTALEKREAIERVSRADAENITTLASTHEDVVDFARKIALLEDELVAERRAWEVSEREHQEQFVELTLLQTRGSELCHAIIGPPQARHHLSEGMRLAALRHIGMAGELAALWATVPSTAESVIRRSPNDTFRVEVVSELVAEFHKLEERRTRLERPVVRIYDLLLRPPPDRA